jgi:hypothetical protein
LDAEQNVPVLPPTGRAEAPSSVALEAARTGLTARREERAEPRIQNAATEAAEIRKGVAQTRNATTLEAHQSVPRLPPTMRARAASSTTLRATHTSRIAGRVEQAEAVIGISNMEAALVAQTDTPHYGPYTPNYGPNGSKTSLTNCAPPHRPVTEAGTAANKSGTAQMIHKPWCEKKMYNHLKDERFTYYREQYAQSIFAQQHANEYAMQTPTNNLVDKAPAAARAQKTNNKGSNQRSPSTRMKDDAPAHTHDKGFEAIMDTNCDDIKVKQSGVQPTASTINDGTAAVTAASSSEYSTKLVAHNEHHNDKCDIQPKIILEWFMQQLTHTMLPSEVVKQGYK